MMQREREVFANEKEVYEKPALAVVRFMFESDITWGSFYKEHAKDDGNNNAGDVDSDWWL